MSGSAPAPSEPFSSLVDDVIAGNVTATEVPNCSDQEVESDEEYPLDLTVEGADALRLPYDNAKDLFDAIYNFSLKQNYGVITGRSRDQKRTIEVHCDRRYTPNAGHSDRPSKRASRRCNCPFRLRYCYRPVAKCWQWDEEWPLQCLDHNHPPFKDVLAETPHRLRALPPAIREAIIEKGRAGEKAVEIFNALELHQHKLTKKDVSNIVEREMRRIKREKRDAADVPQSGIKVTSVGSRGPDATQLSLATMGGALGAAAAKAVFEGGLAGLAAGSSIGLNPQQLQLQAAASACQAAAAAASLNAGGGASPTVAAGGQGGTVGDASAAAPSQSGAASAAGGGGAGGATGGVSFGASPDASVGVGAAGGGASAGTVAGARILGSRDAPPSPERGGGGAAGAGSALAKLGAESSGVGGGGMDDVPLMGYSRGRGRGRQKARARGRGLSYDPDYRSASPIVGGEGGAVAEGEPQPAAVAGSPATATGAAAAGAGGSPTASAGGGGGPSVAGAALDAVLASSPRGSGSGSLPSSGGRGGPLRKFPTRVTGSCTLCCGVGHRADRCPTREQQAVAICGPSGSGPAPRPAAAAQPSAPAETAAASPSAGVGAGASAALAAAAAAAAAVAASPPAAAAQAMPSLPAAAPAVVSPPGTVPAAAAAPAGDAGGAAPQWDAAAAGVPSVASQAPPAKRAA